MEYLALKIGNYEINPPGGVPAGGETDVSRVIGLGIQLFLFIIVIITLIYLIWGGFDWMRSAGDPKLMQSAKSKIIWALIGFILAFSAIFLVNIILYFFNINPYVVR